MNQLNATGGQGLVPQRPATPRTVSRQARGIIAQTQLAGLELDGMAALFGKAIERTTDLYDHAEFLASTRPELRPILMQKVVGFAQTADSHIRSHNSPFGL